MANSMASRVDERIWSTSQFSAYWRIGELPMKVATSMFRPVACWTRATGSMSALTVRAAALASIGSPPPVISRASARHAS